MYTPQGYSLALGQLYNCHSASTTALMNKCMNPLTIMILLGAIYNAVQCNMIITYRWVSATKTKLHYVSNGVLSLLH